jgi:hypothetical protein
MKRWLAPIAAAAAVLGVVAGVSLAGPPGGLHAGDQPPATAGPAGPMPPYYMTVFQRYAGAQGRITTTAAVFDSATGAVLTTVPVPTVPEDIADACLSGTCAGQLPDGARKRGNMISDTLSEAVSEMRGDLQAMPDSYPPGEPLTVRILALIDEMDAVQHEIDDRAAADLDAIDRQYQRDDMGGRRPPV